MHRQLLQPFLKTAACAAVWSIAYCAHGQAAPAALSLIGPGQQTSLSIEALKAMHHVSLTVINGHTHERETYSGIPLIELLEKVGAPQPAAVKGKVLSDFIVATGSDHYRAVLSLAEVEPDFHPGAVIVADTLGGKPIDTKEGPLKLVVEEDRAPARWVHNLVKLELKSVQ